ncbi:MAG: hypothetical protein IJP17_00680 [Clostridia bacterium]|nr:hypothetical protein [Clostridia bacterium]
MNIEIRDREKVLITMDRLELAQYGVEFGSMSLHDYHTKAMLEYMLSMMEDMGLRQHGDRVVIECARGSSGECLLIFTLYADDDCTPRYEFDCADDVIDAALSGVLPERCDIVCEDGRFVLVCAEELDLHSHRLLREYCKDERICDSR